MIRQAKKSDILKKKFGQYNDTNSILKAHIHHGGSIEQQDARTRWAAEKEQLCRSNLRKGRKATRGGAAVIPFDDPADKLVYLVYPVDENAQVCMYRM
jgi:hypothetical protein